MILTITDDFDLQKIADSGQCFRVKAFPEGTYRFIAGSHILYITYREQNTYEISCQEAEWQNFWHSYFDLDRSYLKLRETIPATDIYMKKAAASGAGLRILRQEPWEMLITFIISQQKTIPSIKSAVEKLADAYGDPVKTDYETLHLFPSPKQMSRVTPEELNQFRLGYRTSYILDATQKVSSGLMDLDKISAYDDMQLFTALKSVRGVGDKVANCIALFSYGRTSLAPIDTWIKKVIEKEYQGASPFPDYGETAGIMQQYMFYYAQTHRESYHSYSRVQKTAGK